MSAIRMFRPRGRLVLAYVADRDIRPSTRIKFALPEGGDVSLVVYFPRLTVTSASSFSPR